MIGALAAVAAGTFTLYPGTAASDGRIEAVIQRGPIYELIVNCGNGTAIMTYSPVERLFCAPSGGCTGYRDEAIMMSCGDHLK